MLYTIKQTQTMFIGLLQNSFAGESAQCNDDFGSDQILKGLEAKKQEDKMKFLQQNVDKIGAYLREMDTGSQTGKVDSGDYGWFTDNREAASKILTTLGLDNKWHDGVEIEEVVNVINNYVIEKEVVVSETVKAKEPLKEEVKEVKKAEKVKVVKKSTFSYENTIDTNIFTRTLKKGEKGADVMELQEFLTRAGFDTNGTDGMFGANTEKALKSYQKSVGIKKPDGVLTKNGETLNTIKGLNTNDDYKGAYTNVVGRKANISEVNESIKISEDEIKKMIKLLEARDEFVPNSDAYYDGGRDGDIVSDMGGIWGWGRELSGKNNVENYFEDYAKQKNIPEENKELFYTELDLLVKGINEENSRDDSLSRYMKRDGVLLLLKDISFVDLRLNDIKSLDSNGIPMDKILAFREWYEGGFKTEKPDYSEENLKDISGVNSLRNVRKFRATLTAYGLSNDKIDSALSGKLENLSKLEQKLFYTYIEKSFIPDLVNMKDGGFNFIEKFFDEKHTSIENLINKLQGKKHILDIVAQNDNMFTIEKVNGKYIMETTGNTDPDKNHGRYGAYKVFETYPSDTEIKAAVTEYDKGYYEGSGWDYRILNISGNIDDITHVNVDYYQISENEYVAVYEGKYKIFNHKPTENDIFNESFYSREFNSEGFSDIGYSYDKDLTNKETFFVTGEIFSLLEEQSEEGRWFGGNGELEKAIYRASSRDVYMKEMIKEKDFLDSVDVILEENNPELLKNFSLLKIFGGVNSFLQAFPAPKSVFDKLLKLNDVSDFEDYTEEFISLNEDNEVKEYFDVILKSQKDMKSYHDYRIANIEKYRGLKQVNQSENRKYKYGESMYNKDGSLKSNKEIIDSLLNSTTEKSGEARNIMGNLEAGLVDLGVTSISSADLHSAMEQNMETVSTDTLPKYIINTANSKGLNHDKVTKTSDLKHISENVIQTQSKTPSGETIYCFIKEGLVDTTEVKKTIVTEKVNLVKKDGTCICVTKTYEIYLNPECTNILAITGSTSFSEKLCQPDFDTDLSSVKSATFPFTGFIANKFLKEITGKDNLLGDFGSTSGGSGKSGGTTGGGDTF